MQKTSNTVSTYTDFSPNLSSPAPLREQLANHLRQEITLGKIKKGTVLPSANQFANISHPTVLKAYKQLQQEGLILTKRALGSVVLEVKSSLCYGIVINATNDNNYAIQYANNLLQTLLVTISNKGASFRIYAVDEKVINNPEPIPELLRQDVDQGFVHGVFLWGGPFQDSLFNWLENRKIKSVALFAKANIPTVNVDSLTMVKQGLAYLRKKGHKSLLICSTIALYDKISDLSQTVLGEDFDFRVVAPHSVRFPGTCVEWGRNCVEQFCSDPVNAPDAVFVVDDWTGLGVLTALKNKKKTKAKNIDLLVACNRGPLVDALEDCDRMVVDIDDLAESAWTHLDKRIKGDDFEDGVELVKYKLLPAKK